MVLWALIAIYVLGGVPLALQAIGSSQPLVGLAWLLPVGYAWYRRNRSVEAWRAVGSTHALVHTHPYRLEGEHGGLSLEIESVVALAAPFSLRRTTCRARLEGLPPRLRIFDRTVWSQVVAPVDFRCGDPELDERVSCVGEDDLLLAILDEEMRRTLPHAVEARGMSLEAGELRWDRRHHVSDRVELVTLVEETVRIAERILGAARDRPAALLRNAREDRNSAVRTRNLESLLTRYKGSPEARTAADWALRQPEPEVRFAAAKHVGARGLEPLLELARRFELSVELRRAVIDHLARAYPASQTTEVLVECSLRDDAAAGSAIAHLANLDQAAALGVVERRVAIASEAMVHRFAELLRRVDPARAEPLWLRMLDRQELTLEPVIQIVGEVGGRRFLDPLARIAESEDYQDARAARFAREQIRARLGDSLGEGQLSLSDEGGGELALSVEEGALSEVEDG